MTLDPEQPSFQELVFSVEVVLNERFHLPTVASVAGAIQARISEIEKPASEEALFDENSLELGLLRSLLGKLAAHDIASMPSRAIH